MITAIRLLTDISSTNHNRKIVMPSICVAPEVPAVDTTVMYVEKQGGNLGYSNSCQGYHFYPCNNIIKCISNYFLILYATNIPYMVWSETYGFISDTCFFKRAQTDKYKVLTIRKKFKKIKDLGTRKLMPYTSCQICDPIPCLYTNNSFWFI